MPAKTDLESRNIADSDLVFKSFTSPFVSEQIVAINLPNQSETPKKLSSTQTTEKNRFKDSEEGQAKNQYGYESAVLSPESKEIILNAELIEQKIKQIIQKKLEIQAKNQS